MAARLPIPDGGRPGGRVAVACAPSSREVDDDDDDPGRVAGRRPPATGAESVRRFRARTEPAGRAEGVSDDALGGRRDGEGDTLRC